MNIDLAAIFDAHHAGLYRYLVRLVGDPDLAADAAQEAFLRLSQRPPHTTQNLRAWLYTVATNYAFDTIKVARRRAEILQETPDQAPLAAPAVTPDVSLERQERCQAVRIALDGLREKERTTLLMRAEGFSYREIAAALDISSNSVGVVAARALRKLAGVLQPYEVSLR
ncbi:MAG: sigma-70 family RNA polymerase sigma factor [Gemmatimonadetes bacterium]|nr:sigma-70 family RNA polymerase sigma factor [Gemmatimonadota bacterium]